MCSIHVQMLTLTLDLPDVAIPPMHTENFYDTLSSHYLLDFRRLNITELSMTYIHTQKKLHGKLMRTNIKYLFQFFPRISFRNTLATFFGVLLTKAKLSHLTQNPQNKE